VLVVPMTRNERGALAGLKTTSYAENVLALALAEEAGASEAIFANTRGELCEGTGTNVVIGLEGELRTPPLDSGCLAGVTRALLLEAMAAADRPIAEATLAIDDLRHADEAFLLSTGREVQPIRAVDGRALPLAPGPLTEAAAAVWDSAYGAAAGVVDP
jgi:branched-chain amino acid aminotransferase